MAVGDAVIIAVIGIAIIEGIWLVALTYLMWRRAQREKAASGTPPEPDATKPS